MEIYKKMHYYTKDMFIKNLITYLKKTEEKHELLNWRKTSLRFKNSF
jgi:hypothetical protein